MKTHRKGKTRLASSLGLLALLASPFVLAACGGSSSDAPLNSSSPVAARSVSGTVDLSGQPAGSSPYMTLDNGQTRYSIDAAGGFCLTNVQDGNHTLYMHGNGDPVEMPFRMSGGQGLDLGSLQPAGGSMHMNGGFNGYRYGFADEDGDGVNDLFADANGDGICDAGFTYSGSSYLLPFKWVDEDGDGVNDLFADADGDGVNDLTGMPTGPGFGYLDANGDGIADDTGMPFRHPFGFEDADGDGVNDLFADANGDGVNDLTGMTYFAFPGWVDIDGDSRNDYFADADGDGINDLTGTPYCLAFGWADADGDGVNDRFYDANGDGLNDLPTGPSAGIPCQYGYLAPHRDANGDGLDDVTGLPYGHGFGWVDSNGDGVNDFFTDSNADGVNDYTYRGYCGGFKFQSNSGGTQTGGGVGTGPGSGMGSGGGMGNWPGRTI